MPTTDRRHTPRTKLNQVAYINIGPDNGGIVLNVSGKGLGFHSMVPVERNGAFRLSLQEQNRKIDICGELVWTDKVQKIGGVRFTTLTAEARDRILDWSRKSDPVGGARYSLGSALLKALPRTDSPRSFASALGWWKSGRRLKVSGFTRGLATGFLLSLIAFSVVLFLFGHRRAVGESLIRVGKRLAGNGDLEASRRAGSPSQVISAASSRTTVPIEANSSLAKAVSNRIFAGSDSKRTAQTQALPPVHALTIPSRLPSSDKTHGTIPLGAQSPASEKATLKDAAPRLTSPVIGLSSMAELPALTAKPEPLAMSMHVEPVSMPSVGRSALSLRSNRQMFFDLGRFKKESLAQALSHDLAQIDIHANVVPRRRLWTNSYQVLVGPYDDEAEEQQLNKELVSHGYKPRPFERGSRGFAFRSRVMIDRSQLPTGDFTIAWESYITDAKVKFTQDGDLLAAVDGKWVKRTAKFSQDEYVYQIQADGSHPLLEVHFAGMDRALVFRNLH